MTAQEWLYWHDNFTLHPEYDTYFVAKVCEAATIIRAQQERIERMTAKIAKKEAEIERLKKEVSHTKEVEFPRRVEKVTAMIRAKLQAAESLAAARLADQEAIERHTRRVVAKDCAEIAEAMWSDHYWAWPAMQTYAAEIRKKYEVE